MKGVLSGPIKQPEVILLLHVLVVVVFPLYFGNVTLFSLPISCVTASPALVSLLACMLP